MLDRNCPIVCFKWRSIIVRSLSVYHVQRGLSNQNNKKLYITMQITLLQLQKLNITIHTRVPYNKTHATRYGQKLSEKGKEKT